MLLDDLGDLKRRDPHDTGEVLKAFPAQCRAATRLEAEPRPAGERPALVVVAGMGGSAASGDLLAASVADRLEVPILVHRGYGLPRAAGRRALVIASSYSGETAEVLSAVDTAIARGVPVVAITAGGRLATLAARHTVPCVRLPGGLMPRMALGYLFFPALTMLEAVGLAEVGALDVGEALDVVTALASELAPECPTGMNEAKQLADEIGVRLPVVYGGPDTGPVAYRWKTDIEENAKSFALSGTLPEMNHNEIEAWRAPETRGLHAVLLRDRAESPEIAERFAVLRDMVAGEAGGVSEVWARGEGRLARLLSLLYVGQWTSYYLALQRDVDPWPVPRLDELKRRVGSAMRARRTS